MTAKEIKRMCAHELGISGMSKKPKDVVIAEVLRQQGAAPTGATITPQTSNEGKITGMEWGARSVLSKPNAPVGSKTTTTIHVSCGASSGNFPVVGKSVKEVGDFLREVLNVDQLSTGLVNGKSVDSSYVLKAGDNLEFLKPAGKKG
jgi:hypothetical protein